MKRNKTKKWLLALVLLAIIALLPAFAQSFSTQEQVIEYGYDEQIKSKIPFINTAVEGILKEKSRTSRQVVIAPAEEVTVGDSKSYTDKPPEEITEEIDGKQVTLTLKETKECTEGAEIDFNGELENKISNFYKNGKVALTKYSLGESNDNKSYYLDNKEGMTGTVYKIGDTARIVNKYTDNAVGYDKVEVTVWRAKFQGKVKTTKTGYIGIYEGMYTTSEVCGEAYTVTYYGRVEDKKFIRTRIGASVDYIGDPVAVNTGNFIHTKMDLQMDNLGFPMMFIRTYNSRDHESGLLGRGWSTNWDMKIEKDGANYIFKDFDGRRHNLVLNKGKYSTRETANIDLEIKDGKKYLAYNQIQYVFDQQDKLIQILDSKTIALNVVYENGKIKEVQSKDNAKLSFSYNGGQLSEVRSSAGEVVKLEFNGSQLSKITNPDMSVTQYEYTNSYLTRVIENGVAVIANNYDEIGRIEKQVDDAGITYTIDRSDDNGTVTFTDSSVGEPVVYKINENYQVTDVLYKDGTKESYKYDKNGNKNEVSMRDGTVIKQTFDSENNLKESYVKGQENSKTEYNYDAKNRLERLVRSGRLLETYEYNTSNLMVKKTIYLDEISAAVYEYKYDELGRKIEEISPLKAVTKYEYNGMDNSPKKITYPEGNFVEFEYDSKGQIIKIKDATGTSEMKYDTNGNVIESIDKEGNSTTMKYDGRNRLIETTMPEQKGTNASYKYEYDVYDNIVKVIDPLGNITKSIYSAKGELLKTILPEEFNKQQDSGKGFELAYDKFGRLNKQISPTGQTSAYQYDEHTGQLIGVKSALSLKKGDKQNSSQFEYDDLGRLIVEKDSKGNVIKKNVYDEFGQLIKIIDAKGYLAGNTDDKRYGTLNKYNYQGWLLETRTPKSESGKEILYQVRQYEHDLQGRVITEKTSLEYVTEKAMPTKWLTVNSTYNNNGQLTTVTDSNGSEQKNKYDILGQINEKSEKVTDSLYRITQYEYSPNGNLLKEKLKSWNGDLKSGSAEEIVTAYGYDKNGNCISVTSPEGHITSYTFNANNQLVKEQRKYKQLSYSQEFSKVTLSTPVNQVMPGQNIAVELTAKPNTANSGNTFNIEYDPTVFTYLETAIASGSGKETTAEVQELEEGKLLVKTSGLETDKNNPVIRLVFAASEENTGKSQIKITAESFMQADSSPKSYDLLQGVCINIKGPDINRDGKVKADDLSLIGKNSGKTNLRTRIEKMSDLNADGVITDDDLDIFKKWLFEDTEKNLKPLENPSNNTNITTIAPTETILEKDYSVVYEYNRNGNLISVTDSEGNRTTSSYNASGDLIEERSSTGEVTKYEYLVDGILAKTTRNSGYKSDVTQYEYNVDGQITAIKNGAGEVLEAREYNALGQLTQTKREKATTKYIYDIGHRLIEATEVSGSQSRTTKMTYDVRDLMLTQTDAKGQATSYKYDNWGNLVETTDPLGNKTAMTYDYLGRQTSLKDPKNQVFEYTYTADGKTKTVKYPDGKSIRYVYDKDGNTVEKVNKDDSKVLYEYNELGQCVKEVSGADEVHYALSPDNRLLSAWNNSALVENSFDSHNRLAEVRQNGDLIAQYTYDGFGRRQSETDQTGMRREFNYEGDYVSGISVDGKISANFSRNKLGQLTNTKYSNGVNLSVKYGDYNEIESINWEQNGKLIDNFQYEYDALGNVTKEQNKNATLNYEYDALSRLTSAKSNKNFEETYQYDAVGNRTEKVTNGIRTSYEYGSNNQLLEATTGRDKTTFSYDANSRLQTETSKDNTRQYTYDGFNRLKQVTDKNGSFENVYNPIGERISTIENGTTTQFSYGADGLLTEQVDNSLERNYIGTASGLLMQADSDGNFYNQVTNRRGDVKYLVTGSKIINQYEYSPYGELLGSVEGLPNHMRYAGEMQDSFTGDYYLNSRFYSPELGRFTQEDSYLGDGNNLYAYVQNNPMNYVDPSGMSREACYTAAYEAYVTSSNSLSAEEELFTLLEDGNGQSVPAAIERYGNKRAAIPFDLNQFHKSYAMQVTGHTMLDVAGCIDPTGLIDVLNGAWYAVEGDVTSAAISYASAYPLGDLAKLKHVKAYVSALTFSKTKVMMSTGKKAFQFVCKDRKDVIRAAKEINEKAGIYACFTAGTKIQTEHGEKPIEQIEVGDYVWSENPETGEKTLKEVTETFEHQKSELIKLTIGSTVIETTAEHPFWVEGEGWVNAGDLKTGDFLRLKSGKIVALDQLEVIKLETPITVYNFTVEDNHDYYVSEIGVLVHNKAAVNPKSKLLVEGAGKTGGEIVFKQMKSYEQARNKAFDIIGDLGKDSKAYIGRLGSGEGKVVGRQSADGKVRWRLDYDPTKGPHINVEDFRNGKGPDGIKIAIPFDGDINTVEQLLKHLNK